MEPEARDVEANAQDWIDPAAARRLLLEYRQTLGVKGGSEIERQIRKHTKLVISRKTLENWLNERGADPSPITMMIVTRFLQTAHFQKVVPRARDYLESDARFCRIGAALFDLYGAEGCDPTALIELNAVIAGWWIAERVFERNSPGPSFLYIAPVTDRSFSKIHVLIRNDEVPVGSGIAFPKVCCQSWPEYLVRLYSKERYFREKALLIEVPGTERTALRVTFTPRDNPVQFPGSAFISVQFSRIAERDVLADVRETFDDWSRDVLPHGLGRHEFLAEGSPNPNGGLEGNTSEAFAAVRQRDKAIEDAYDPTESN